MPTTSSYAWAAWAASAGTARGREVPRRARAGRPRRPSSCRSLHVSRDRRGPGTPLLVSWCQRGWERTDGALEVFRRAAVLVGVDGADCLEVSAADCCQQGIGRVVRRMGIEDISGYSAELAARRSSSAATCYGSKQATRLPGLRATFRAWRNTYSAQASRPAGRQGDRSSSPLPLGASVVDSCGQRALVEVRVNDAVHC